MDIIEIMNNYSLIIVISGLLSCIICGAAKIPIVRKIREYGELKQLESKVVASYIRNICTMIVAVLSAVFVALWYCISEGARSMLGIRVYAEILGAFTASKLIYMLYEGAGSASIKKLIHGCIDKLKSKKRVVSLVNSDCNKNIATTVQEYLTKTIHLPLTEQQVEGLNELLQLAE